MRQLVPGLIIENYLQGNYRGEFLAVGLFVDISGFSTITDALMRHGQHGAEVLARIMRRVFGLPSQSIYEQGGFIVGYAGDAFTALFPVKTDPADAARRALAAAWAIQQQMASEPTHSTEYGAFPISAKIGLALGETRWGILRSGDGQRAAYYFKGAAVNASAAAEHRARAGEIILDQSFYVQVAADVAVSLLSDDFCRLFSLVRDLPVRQNILSSPPALEVTHAFFPQELLYQDLRSEFRQAINLFISLPDLSAEALETFMAGLFELQALFGGLFTRVDFGDKGCNILLFWGAPVAYENDIERALNFVLGLKERAGFPFTAGVTYYISRAGFMGSDFMEEYTCYGWGINLAARLMLGAPRGQIWLDERVASRAEQRFEVSFVGKQNFKGFAQPQMVFVLEKRKKEVVSFFQGKMFGREAELRALADFVAPLWKGRFAGSFTIWGDPGIGKSRLVYEFQRSKTFQAHPAHWAFCQSDQVVRKSFNPFRYWMGRYFGLSGSHEESRSRENIEAKLKELGEAVPEAALADDLLRTSSCLAALLDIYWADSFYDRLDAQGRYDNTFIALTALIKLESLRQPLVIFLEDAQYLDSDSTAFIRALLRSLRADSSPYPVAILSTSRREGAALPLETTLLEQALDLSRLPLDSLARLAETMLGGPPADDLLSLLEERAEGNPFFTEQILRYLQDESRLQPGPGGWHIAHKGEQTALPADIRAVLVARLDQLAHTVKNVIQTAAVLGREFEVQVLAHMLRGNDSLPADIQSAEKAAIWTAISEIRYLFKHALLRDAAYTMQMQARRQELHALALESLETLFAGRLESHLGELAFHAEQANLTEKARFYLEQAGDQARGVYQNAAAAGYYTRALAFIPAEDHEAHFQLHLRLEEVYDQIGNRQAQKASLEALRRLAETASAGQKRGVVSRLEALYLHSLGEYLPAIERAGEAIRLARQAGDKETVMRAYAYTASGLLSLGRFAEAASAVEAGLWLARELGHVNGEAQQLNVYGLIAIKLRDYETARTRLEHSLALYRQAGNLRGELSPLSNLGLVYSYLGEYSLAQAYYEQAMTAAREVGDLVFEGTLARSIGWILGLQGSLELAVRSLERALRLAQETAHRRSAVYTLLNLSAYSELLGRAEAALGYADQALLLAQELQDSESQAWVQHYRGHALLVLGRTGEARAAYQAALALYQPLGFWAEAAEPAAGLARAALLEGNLPEALQQVELVLPLLERDRALAGTDQPLRVYLTCYTVLRAAGSDERASAVLAQAHQLLMERLDNIKDKASQQSFVENISYHREILRAWEQAQGAL